MSMIPEVKCRRCGETFSSMRSRCPNCGKVIFLGVMAVKACPRCHRNLVTGKKMKSGKSR